MIEYNYEIYIITNNVRQNITNLVSGDIVISTQRNLAGKLTFTVETELVDDVVDTSEGSLVEFYVNKYAMFKGFIFSQSRGLNEGIKITVYDQLRYFKNKDTYVYNNKKASDVLKMIANDFNILTGVIDDTGYVIGSRTENGQTLSDIMMTAAELTLVATNKMYVLYDDFGKVCFRNIDNLRLPIMLTDDETLISADYKSDIDSDTYNQIKLYNDNKESGKKDIFIAKDSGNINRWGMLQYYAQAENSMSDTQIDNYAQRLLKVKNRVKKTMKISCLGIGNDEEKIRGGSVIFIKIKSLNINNWFVVESVTHTFSNNQHEISISVYDF